MKKSKIKIKLGINKKAISAGRQGFSMIEVLVAMFISTLIILASTAAFASAFRAQKEAREVQRSIEEAKGTLEYMAKIIRMSSNITATPTKVSMYSKSMDECKVFSYGSGKITEYNCSPISDDNPCANANVSDCSGGSYNNGGSGTQITGNGVLSDAEFSVPGLDIERVTIRMEMANDSNAKLQTTVSARDYRNLNPIEK